MSEFDTYRLPMAVTEGVEIALKGTPAKFLVRLPCRANEDFTMRLLLRLSMAGKSMDEGVNVVEMQIERKKLFLEECVIKATGLPDDMDVQDFFRQYALAGRSLFERAQELGREADDEVEKAMGNLEPSPSGSHSGEGSTSNTKTSSRQASNPKQADQKSAA